MAGMAKLAGGKLEGLAFRLKSEDSLARKIAKTAAAKGMTAEQAAQAISDALRYTIVADAKGYSRAASKVVRALRDAGYTVRVKNYWVEAANPYQGVNLALVDPRGQRLELQLHTPESLRAKGGEMHKLYESRRQLPDGDQRAIEMDAAMSRISKAIPIPDGVEAVK
jgi:hypothetical protein